MAGDRLNIISGPDEICLGGMVAGADAAIGSTYNIMPNIFLRMRRHFEAGEIRLAMELQAQANRVISTMMRFGVLGALKAELGMRGSSDPSTPNTRLTRNSRQPYGATSMT